MGELAVDIFIAGGAEDARVEHCAGPDASGLCPRVAAGHLVPCAGRRLRAHGVPTEGWDMHVAADATDCPYAWLLTHL